MANKALPPAKEAGILSVKGLTRLLYYLMKIQFPDIRFVPAYPDYIFPKPGETQATPTDEWKPTITYKILKEEVGGEAQNKQPFDGFKTFNSRIIEVVQPKLSSEGTIVKSKLYDTLLQFDIWDISNEQVDQYYEEVRRYFTELRDFIKHQGVREFCFWSGGEDRNSLQMKNHLNRRTLVFYVKSMELYTVSETALQNINIRLADAGYTTEE